MAITINNNVASLQAQEYLRMNGDFQAKTIGRVTSGLRILSAGDDAAGLAIANGLRSDQAVLTQGIRNANDGMSTLQIIDGGINNISMLLDRARSLATQSASGTFSGSRSVLNSEFQSVLSEIDRQAQAIGLNQNGIFAKALDVFIGGGRTSGGVTEISNGSVSVDLSKAAVDAQALGLKGVQAGNTGYDLSTGATKVETVAADSTNTGSLATAGFTKFKFTGAGFGDNEAVEISVNTAGLNSTESLVSAVNAAISSAAAGPTSAAAKFKEAGVTAKVVTDADGKQQLAFSSSNSAFQVSGQDRLANALLGNYSAGATGTALGVTTTFGARSTATDFGASTSVKLRFEGAGLTSPYELTVDTSSKTIANAATDIQTAIANDATLKAAGVTMTGIDTTAGVVFTAAKGEKVYVSATGDSGNRLGMGGFQPDGSGNFEYNTITVTAAGATINAENTRLSFSFNGGTSIDVNIAWTTANIASTTLRQDAVNAAINGVAALREAGITAVVGSATTIALTAAAGTKFRLQTTGSSANASYGSGITAVASFTAPTYANSSFKAYSSQGAYQVGADGTAAPLAFSAINFASDKQTLTITGVDTTGATHLKSVTLDNTNARSLDEAIGTINAQLQNSNDSTLQSITAIKVNDGGAEKLQFISTTKNFQVAIGKNASSSGVNQTAANVSSTQVGAGATSSIDTASAASSAVTALSAAVSMLGTSQAVVGKGQNQFNFAISLASTQLTNIASSESRIRDADLAAEAANLTKAQILVQAGVAALAQANSAPQAVLSLLRG